MSDLVVILTTLPADDRAVAFARTLVAERLAACVNVHTPMASIYRWKTALEEEPERQVVIKTTRDRMERVRARLRNLHPYELPEWIVLPAVEASAEYAEWVKAETAAPGT
jgi:periplasmic divalent cation tolerance protein